MHLSVEVKSILLATVLTALIYALITYYGITA